MGRLLSPFKGLSESWLHISREIHTHLLLTRVKEALFVKGLLCCFAIPMVAVEKAGSPETELALGQGDGCRRGRAWGGGDGRWVGFVPHFRDTGEAELCKYPHNAWKLNIVGKGQWQA